MSSGVSLRLAEVRRLVANQSQLTDIYLLRANSWTALPDEVFQACVARSRRLRHTHGLSLDEELEERTMICHAERVFA